MKIMRRKSRMDDQNWCKHLSVENKFREDFFPYSKLRSYTSRSSGSDASTLQQLKSLISSLPEGENEAQFEIVIDGPDGTEVIYEPLRLRDEQTP